jgi:hypothetical protein
MQCVRPLHSHHINILICYRIDAMRIERTAIIDTKRVLAIARQCRAVLLQSTKHTTLRADDLGESRPN